ncbi:MAG: ABC transporter permease [Oscillospiraceae bacterium]|jgi:ribose transport system permease protein|nr:ABC transporter permease [Oscillospiraceae bacterium]
MKKLKLQDVVPFAAFIVIFVFFTIASGGKMLSAYNLRILLDQSMITIVVGLGVLFVAAQGSIDLSVGVNVAFSGVLATHISLRLSAPWLLIPAALAISAAVGLVIGVIVSKLKVSSFMTTIAMLIGIRGVVNYIQTKIGVEYLDVSLKILNEPYVKIPLFIAVTAVMAYLFEFTKLGRYSRAIGENETTARSVGVPVEKMKIAVFLLSGLLAGVGAIFTLISVGGSTNTMGNFLEMKVAMAIFLGGVLVTGGASARIYKVLLGAFSITIIVNGLALIGKSESQISETVEGILLLLILYAATAAARRDRRRSVKQAVASETSATEST